MKTIKGALVDVDGSLHERNVIIEGSKIIEISLEEKGEVIDAKGKLLAPSFIDLHVHMREPGFEHKGTFESEGKACAKGGFTRVFAMPNTKPSPDTVDNFLMIKDKTKSSPMEVEILCSMTEGSRGKKLSDVKALTAAGALGFSDDGVPIMDDSIMEEALKAIKEAESVLMVHEEDLTTFKQGAVNRGPVSEHFGVDGIPNQAESNMVYRDALLAERTGGHVHICHMSTKESLAVVEEAKKKGVPITCEVTPHHLLLTDEIVIEQKGYGKVNPPLRSEEDRLALLDGLKRGVIDAIATDHAPHDKKSKERPIETAAFGFIGIEFSFASLYTELVLKGHLSLEELLYYMSGSPARVMKLKEEGFIKEGYDANLVLIDLEAKWTLTEDTIISMGKNTPLLGKEFYGETLWTMYQGEMIYEKSNSSY